MRPSEGSGTGPHGRRVEGPRPRGREPHYAPAFLAALILLLAGALLLPESWIRALFVRDFGPPPSELALDPRPEIGPIRLIPPSSLPASPPRTRPAPPPPVREQLLPVERPPAITVEEDREEAPADGTERDHAWTWDPTTSWTVIRELTSPTFGTGSADSVARRATLLRALRLGDLDPALAMLDTTQSALARERFRQVDAWIVRHRAAIWSAQGDAARRAAIYERAVTEAERDEGM